jgi:hypothetical protein
MFEKTGLWNGELDSKYYTKNRLLRLRVRLNIQQFKKWGGRRLSAVWHRDIWIWIK